ncbi:MAG: FMN-binding protein [Gordonia sp. (in: high G+C Gram-positive bacteria)]
MPHLTDSPVLLRASGMAAGIAVVGLAVAGCGSSDSTDKAADSTTPAASATTSAHDHTDTPEYKDGKYSATGTYQSPGGQQQIGVTVELKDDKITTLSLDRSKTKGTSAEFQGKFASGIDAQVIGKNIDDLDVHKVSGSSLTSGGFNDAIDQIKSEAKA